MRLLQRKSSFYQYRAIEYRAIFLSDRAMDYPAVSTSAIEFEKVHTSLSTRSRCIHTLAVQILSDEITASQIARRIWR